jgi:hypothetical protein
MAPTNKNAAKIMTKWNGRARLMAVSRQIIDD